MKEGFSMEQLRKDRVRESQFSRTKFYIELKPEQKGRAISMARERGQTLRAFMKTIVEGLLYSPSDEKQEAS